MHPRLELLGHTFSSYHLLVGCAAVLGLALLYGGLRGQGCSWKRALFLAGAGSLGVVAGTRLTAWLLGARLWSLEGMSLLGGFAGGAALLAAAAARAPIGAWQALDSGALAAALAAAIARLGCLLAGCCHGRPTLFPIAIVYDDFASAARPIGVPLHATQVYESLLCATFFVATLLRRGAGAPPRAGLIGVLFVGTYCAGRFGLDFLRADAFVRVGPLSVVQWTCLALVAAAAVAWRWGRRSGDARQ